MDKTLALWAKVHLCSSAIIYSAISSKCIKLLFCSTDTLLLSTIAPNKDTQGAIIALFDGWSIVWNVRLPQLSALVQESAIPRGGTRCDWSIYDKTGMWWQRECGWQWRMTEQITVYRLRSGPLSCDASLYCAAVKRFIYHGVALLYSLLFLIWQTAEQRTRQQSPSRHSGKAENALWREIEEVCSNIVPSKERKREGLQRPAHVDQTGTTTGVSIFN